MHNCSICSSKSTYAFDSNYTKVHRCTNKYCGHLFAVDSLPFQGVHHFENDSAQDFSVYEERNDHLIEYFKKHGIIKSGDKILDFGAGSGHILKSMANSDLNLQITAVEYNDEYHDNLRKIGCSIFKSIEEIPKEQLFDFIIFIEVIEHLDDPLAVVSKLKQKLRSGGKLFLTTPAGNTHHPLDNATKLYTYKIPEHVQFFTEKSLKSCCARAGFKNISYKYINALYPNKGFNSLTGKKNTLMAYYTHLRGYTMHLTYILS